MEVYECENGETALAAYQAHNPDVVLMAWDAKSTTADPSAYVVIVTNYDGTDPREAAHQAGARGYVLKEDLQELHGC